MKTKDFENILKEHGTGTIKSLNKYQLESLQKICKGVRDSLADNCMSHALYRCNLSSNDNLILLLISGTDARGNMKELHVGLNLDTMEVYTLEIELENRKLIGKEIYDMIVKLMKVIPYPIGMLDIPMEGKFEEGVELGYNKEEGTYLIVIKDSLNYSFFTEF